jgi:hypothetical protein
MVGDSEAPGMTHESKPESDFAAEASKARPSLVREFAEFLAENKKWWLAPILLAVLIAAALVVLGGTAAAPFIYSLF